MKKKIVVITLLIIAVILIVGILFFSKESPVSDTGKGLALESLNPDDEVSSSVTVKVYFNYQGLEPTGSCNDVMALEKVIPKTQAVARAAIEELLRGPTAQEQMLGWYSSINPGVKIQSLNIGEKGTARIDFDERLQEAVGGSCRVAAIRAQITKTLKQFPTIKNVIISINGRTEDILQP